MKSNLLRSAIVANGMTVEDVAKQLGITRNTMYKRLNGHSEFSIADVVKLCEMLNIRDNKQKADIFLS